VHELKREMSAGGLSLKSVAAAMLAAAIPNLSLAVAPAEARPPSGQAPASRQKPTESEKAPEPKALAYPITVIGRALDPKGAPIAKAKIYLASQAVDWGRLAETTTDAAGRYAFREIPLPIDAKPIRGGPAMGKFQVFGQAEGYGFAWRPTKHYSPIRLPAANRVSINGPDEEGAHTFEAEDVIDLDLVFSPAARLSGRVVDDKGTPISNVRIAIRDCERLIREPGAPLPGFDALNERETAPPEMKLRTTDASGRFEFTGLPRDCRFRIDVRPNRYLSRWVYAATSDAKQADFDGFPVHNSDFTLTFVTPVEVPIEVLYADTGKPAAKVAVSCANSNANAIETTDERGIATLRVTPGLYQFQLLPAHGTPYLVTESEFTVESSAPAKPIVKTLHAAAVIEMTVVDEEGGAGLRGIDAWRRSATGGREEIYFRSWEVETRIAHVERPRTDSEGKLRLLVEPGTHHIGAGFNAMPNGYRIIEAVGVDVECKAGEIAKVSFKARRSL
jgi:hypothetical protein